MINKRISRLLIGLAALILPLSVIGFATPFDVASASSTTRYEAENASINNAEKKYVSGSGSYAFGVSGVGFVGFNGGNESSITFTVNVNDQGIYKLYVKYAVGMDSSGIKVEYNGFSQTIGFTQNNGWGSFNTTEPLEVEGVKLYKGNNAITISRAYSDKYGEIDYIEIGECTEIDNQFDLPSGSNWIKYEAENASINNAEKKYVSGSGSYAFGVSGVGFVGFSGGNESSITFTLNVSDQGFYKLCVKYAVGMDGSGVKIDYNGLSDTINFTKNNGWGSFNKTSPLETTVRLKKGNNAITISRAYSDKYGEIDYIAIGDCTEIDNPPELPSGSNWVKYESEAASTDNASKKYIFCEEENPNYGGYARGASGTGFVGFNGGNNSTITFTVSVDKNGVYELAVKYAVGMDGSGVKIECNNLSDTINFTENNGWGSFNTTSPLKTTVGLKKGNNAVTISRAYSDKYGEIDYIAIGEYIEEFNPSVTEWTKYEAENGEVVLGTRKKGSNSTVYVGNIDYDLSYIDFNLYNLEEGAYEVKVKYATDFTGKKIKIYTGERGRDGRFESYGQVDTYPSGWGNFVNNAKFLVSLKGNSFIRIYSRYVEIDYIEISNRVGDFFHGEGDSVQPDNDITDGGFVKLG